jgi:hypothetical protein
LQDESQALKVGPLELVRTSGLQEGKDRILCAELFQRAEKARRFVERGLPVKF